MAGEYKFRTLTEKDMGQMHRSFLEAFSEYPVNMKMSREAFEDRMLRKLNICFDLSPAIFAGEKLIGFIFQTINEYEGVVSAYNGGTGVIPGHTGQGFTARMYEHIAPMLMARGVRKCVLEVLCSNKRALQAYENAGFGIDKELQCMMLKEGRLTEIYGRDYPLKTVENFDLYEYRLLGDIQACMLDQLSQIRHHLDKETIIEYRKEGTLLGFVIFQSDNGRIAQIAVKKEYRRQGLGRALIRQVYRHSGVKTLSVLNIETKEIGVTGFFEKLGFEKDLMQYEMQMMLSNG